MADGKVPGSSGGGLDFRGRSRRSEFWRLSAVMWLAVPLAMLLTDVAWYLGVVALPFVAYGVVLWCAALVRRFHDVGRSAWWLLVGLVPVVGELIVLYCLVRDGDRTANRWGASPKYAPAG